MKKFYFLSFILLFFVQQVSAQVWDGVASNPWTSGDGSESNPFLIETPAQLAYFSYQVGQGHAFEGKFFRQINDLNMGDKEFPVIGKYDKGTDSQTQQTIDDSYYFKGTFDGNHKTIDHLRITKAPSATGSIGGVSTSLGGTALFACITDGSVVKNITIGVNSHIMVDGEIVAGVIGVMEGGLLENSMNLGTVSCATFCGGLVGYANGSSVIRNCANKGSVSTKGMICGGIVGQMEKTASVQACYNLGPVTGKSFFVGGIAGICYDKVSVKNCYNIGKVDGPTSFMGKPHAIIGEIDGNKVLTADNYYVETLTGVSETVATAVSEDDLKSAALLEKLNKDLNSKVFVADSKNQNGGFPVFNWEQTALTGIATALSVSGITLNGRNIYSPTKVSVVDMSGRVVASGKDIHLTNGGVYLILVDKQPTLKVIVR